MDTHDTYWWLYHHPAFAYKGRDSKRYSRICYDGYPYGESGFDRSFEFSFQKVDPKTLRIEDDKSRNTHTRVWVEATVWLDPDERLGPYACPLPSLRSGRSNEWREHTGIPSHDYRLDCGGNTVEEAMLKLAELVREHYGDYDFDPYK